MFGGAEDGLAPARGYVRKQYKRSDAGEEGEGESPSASGSRPPSKPVPQEAGWTTDEVPQTKTSSSNSTPAYLDQVESFSVVLDNADDITTQVASAPSAQHQKVQTLHELNSLISSAQPVQVSTDGINMSVLLSSIFPLSMVSEPDIAWDHSTLLKEVTLELQAEREGKVPDPSEASSESSSSRPRVPPLSSTISDTQGATLSSSATVGPRKPQFTQTMIGGRVPS